MKEFLASFQVDTENKAIAGVCAGLANYFNIETMVVRGLAVLLFLASTEISILTVIVYAYLAGWLSREPLDVAAQKTRDKAILVYILLLVLTVFGSQGLTLIFESGKVFGQWLSGLF